MDLPMNIHLSWLTEQPKTVEDYKVAIESRLKKYDYVITDDNREEAESDKKDLKQAYDKIHRDRINAYAEFDKAKKEMISVENMIKEKIDLMGSQIKELDQHLIDEKMEEITEYFLSKDFTLIQLDQIFDKKWLNKTCSNWKAQIDLRIDEINSQLDIIDNFGVSDEEKEEIKGYYLDCLNVMEARRTFDVKKERREQLKKQQEQKQASKPQKQAPSETFKEEIKKEVQQVKKQRIVAQFIATREFYDYLNVAIKKYNPKVEILEKEDIE